MSLQQRATNSEIVIYSRLCGQNVSYVPNGPNMFRETQMILPVDIVDSRGFALLGLSPGGD